MSESPHKKMKIIQNLPEDVVEHIMSSFLPIKSVLQNRLVSKKFRNTEIRCRDLDFSEIYSKRRMQSEVVNIIENIFHYHKGPEINRFILFLNHIGVSDKILSWIKTCLGKNNIQELVLDFSKSKKLIDFSVDFSAIKTLTILKLKWCKFEISEYPPKGLKLLRTLSLMQTELTKEMVDAVFANCIHLESLELIKCRIFGLLNINAKNNKNFKSLVVFSQPQISYIVVDAPTLEFYKYDGYVRKIIFSRVDALKEASLNYNRSKNWRCYDSSDMVLANMSAYTGVQVLATTNIFLEAFTYRYIDGKMRKPSFMFLNLKEFRILFKAPTICTLYHIAEFLEHCPKLEKVLIDIKNFTFEPGYFWEFHHKQEIQVYNKELLKSIKEVKINGYKGHMHEFDIVKFFVNNAKSLQKLELITPTKARFEIHEPDEMLNYIENIFTGRL